MSSATETKPKLTDDVCTQWPPKAHLVRKEDLPAKEGTIALCGAKLMGLDLEGHPFKANCKKCIEVMQRELS